MGWWSLTLTDRRQKASLTASPFRPRLKRTRAGDVTSTTEATRQVPAGCCQASMCEATDPLWSRRPACTPPGRRYEWVNAPGEHALAPLPGWVSEKLSERKVKPRRLQRTPAACIVEGERNDSLFRFACQLRGIGCEENEIAAALTVRNADRCHPPLEANEVATVAGSAARYSGVWLSDAELLAQGLHPYTLAIYLAIRARASHQGVCIASYDNLAHSARVGISRAKTNAIPELEAARLVTVKRPPPRERGRGRNANEYTLRDPSQHPAPAHRRDTTTGGTR
jgi:hypothetical protein